MYQEGYDFSLNQLQFSVDYPLRQKFSRLDLDDENDGEEGETLVEEPKDDLPTEDQANTGGLVKNNASAAEKTPEGRSEATTDQGKDVLPPHRSCLIFLCSFSFF